MLQLVIFNDNITSWYVQELESLKKSNNVRIRIFCVNLISCCAIVNQLITNGGYQLQDSKITLFSDI